MTENYKNYLKITNSFDDPKIKILRAENKERDIYPFFKIYKKETKAGDIIIKYHHKLSPHLKYFLVNE